MVRFYTYAGLLGNGYYRQDIKNPCDLRLAAGTDITIVSDLKVCQETELAGRKIDIQIFAGI